MLQIAPSILAADFACLGQAVRDLNAAGADMIHIDVMDGRFVPNITIGPAVVASLRPLTSLPLDVHLMIVEPARYVPDFVRAGADIITVHQEADHNLHRTLNLIASLGKKPGLALNPHSPACLAYPVLDLCALVLVMSVNPGFGGQEFIASSLSKIAELKNYIDQRQLPVLLEVDGGVNKTTGPVIVAAGADILVAGSAVFAHRQGIRAAIRELKHGG